MKSINVYPLSTEKAYGLSLSNTYVFQAPLEANKQQIVDAIETQFSVKVVSIKTLVNKGKAVRASRGKRSNPGIAYRKDVKKAYVTLAKGDKIQIFEEPSSVEPAKKAEDKKEKK